MPTPPYAQEISINDILSEARQGTGQEASFETSGVKIRPGQGPIFIGSVGYPNGSRRVIPSSGQISYGNYHDYSYIEPFDARQAVEFVWAYKNNTWRNIQGGATAGHMTAPNNSTFFRTDGKYYNSVPNVTNTEKTTGLALNTATAYFDGQGSPATPDNFSTLQSRSTWTTILGFTTGFTGTTFPTNPYSGGIYYQNDLGQTLTITGNEVARIVQGSSSCITLTQVNTDLPRIRRVVQTGAGGNSPRSAGLILLPGRWEVLENNALHDIDEFAYRTSLMTLRSYKEDPWRFETVSGTTVIEHKLYPGDRVRLSSGTSWGAALNQTTWGPLTCFKNYYVTNDNWSPTTFSISEFDGGPSIGPSGAATGALVTGLSASKAIKTLNHRSASIQLHFRSHSNSQDFPHGDFNSLGMAGGFIPAENNDANGWNPLEARERKIWRFWNGADSDGSGWMMCFNDTDQDQTNSWKSFYCSTYRWFFGTAQDPHGAYGGTRGHQVITIGMTAVE